MTSNALHTRIDRAGLTVEQFAEIIGVDPKTVQRWLAGRVPYRRHRVTIARALDTSEHQLWPDHAPAPDAAPVVAGPPGDPGDVVGSWGEADQPGAPDPGRLLIESSGPVDVLDSARRLLCDDRLIAALLDASTRSPVRVLVDVPRRELCPLLGVPQVELRVLEDNAGGVGLIRISDRLLVFLDLPGALDQARPLLALQDRSQDGLSARYLDHFEDLWEQAGDPIKTDEQLRAIVELDADWVEEDDDPRSQHQTRPPDPPPPSAPDAGERPRRWPRTPD